MVATRKRNNKRKEVVVKEYSDNEYNDEDDGNIYAPAHKFDYKRLETYKASQNWGKMWNNKPLQPWFTNVAMNQSLQHTYEVLAGDDIKEYVCEEACHQKNFDIMIKKVNKKSVKCSKNIGKQNLLLYESYNLKYSSLDKTYINVGGPIWSIAWCPCTSFPQYLAVSTHKNMVQLSYIGEKISEKGSIQIWSFDKQRNPKLIMIIAHDYDPIFEMKWCPYTNDNDDYIGWIAFCGCDEIIRIMRVPSPKHLLNEKNGKYIYIKMKVAVNLLPCSKNLHSEKLGLRHEFVGNAISFSWYPFKPHNKIVAGYSNGQICAWDLDNENLLEHPNSEFGTLNIYPEIMKSIAISSVTGVEFCPHIRDWIVVYGLARRIYFLDITRPDEFCTYTDKYVAKCLKWTKYCSEPYIIDLLYPATFKNGLRPVKLIPSTEQNDDEAIYIDPDVDRLFSLSCDFMDMSVCNYSGFIVATTSNGSCLVTNKNCDFGESKVRRIKEACVFTVNVDSDSKSMPKSSNLGIFDNGRIPKEKISKLNECIPTDWGNGINEIYRESIKKGFVFNEMDKFYYNSRGDNIVNRLINSSSSGDYYLLDGTSLNRAALNENLCCLGWLATGGNSGILKIEDLSAYLIGM